MDVKFFQETPMPRIAENVVLQCRASSVTKNCVFIPILTSKTSFFHYTTRPHDPGFANTVTICYYNNHISTSIGSFSYNKGYYISPTYVLVKPYTRPQIVLSGF